MPTSTGVFLIFLCLSIIAALVFPKVHSSFVCRVCLSFGALAIGGFLAFRYL